MTRRRAILTLLVAASAPGCASPPARADEAEPRAIAPARLDAAFLVVRGRPPRAEEHARLAALADPAALAAALMDDPAIDRRAAPMMLLGRLHAEDALWGQSPGQVLETTALPSGEPLYFLDRPCAPAGAVAVHPWWDVRATVRVCKDAYRPEAYALDGGATCNSGRIVPGRRFGCGCGPNLAWCVRGDRDLRELKAALREEVDDTVAYASAHGWPLERLFTSNETVRRPMAEFEEQRIRLAQHLIDAMPDRSAWPAEGRLAPRAEVVPGQHAGILTTPHVLFSVDGFRARMQDVAELLWCVRTRGLNTRTDVVLHLGANSRDGDGWRTLAALPACTDCHARMDYAQEFFRGFPRSLDGLAFDARRAAPGRGPIYLRNIDDPRGEARLTPAGFVEQAMRQPEFARCMVKRVADPLFGDAPDAEVVDAIRAAFDRTHQLRPMIAAALVAYLRDDRAQEPALPAAPATPATAAELADDDPPRAVPAPLRAELASRCPRCHSAGPLALVGATLPRSMLVRAATQIAMKTMPKGDGPGPSGASRRALLHALLDAAFAGEPARARVAERHLQAMLDYAPTQRPGAMAAAVAARAGVAPRSPWLLERNVSAGLTIDTPGSLLVQGALAAAACARRPVAARAACIEGAFRVDDALVRPLGPARP